MSSSYRISLDNWLKELDVGAAGDVLDIGGSQLPVRGRTKTWSVQGDYIIADLPTPHIGSPSPDIELDLNDCYRNEVLAIDRGFGLIFCLEVFDYIYNPLEAFNAICDLLLSDGTAWVSFPSFYPLHQPIEDDALRYMPGGIQKLADSVGLTVKEWIPRRAETNKLQEFFSAERMRAAKGEEHNITGWICKMVKE